MVADDLRLNAARKPLFCNMFKGWFGNPSEVNQLQQRVDELGQEVKSKNHDLRNANFQIEELSKQRNVLLTRDHSTSSHSETQRQIKGLEEATESLQDQRIEIEMQRDTAYACALSLQEDSEITNAVHRVENPQNQCTRCQVSTSSHVEQRNPKRREKGRSKQTGRFAKTNEAWGAPNALHSTWGWNPVSGNPYAKVASLTDELTTKREHIEDLKRLLDKEKTDHEGARALLASKTEELRSMRPFLMTADDVPLAEVLTLVEDLNSEVYTTAAAIADWVASEGLWAKGNSSSMGKEGSRSRVTESLGQNMVQLLASNESSTAQENIVLVCQAGLLTLCQTLVECWTSPGNPADALLASIYDNMQSIANQHVAGRWRSLTAKHLGKYDVGIETTDITLRAIPLLEAILIVAGCDENDASASVRKFIEQLIAVGELVTKTRKAIREDIISSDLCLVCISNGAAFDSTKMEDEDGHMVDGGVVFCTTALGLQEKVKSEEGSGERQPLRPKVMLLSSVFQ